MKIAIVTSKINSLGGVEIFNRDIKNILEERKHKVDLIGMESLNLIPQKGLEKAVGDYFNKVNEREKYDIVLCNGEFGFSVDHPKAINVFHGNYYGYALSVQDLVPKELTRERLKKAEMQKVSAEGKYVVTVSNSSRSQLEEFGIPVDKVINNSADTNLFFPKNLPLEDHALSLARGRYYEKGFDVIKRLADKGVNIRLYSDLNIDSPHIESLDFIENSKLCNEYNKAKILLFPSRFEGGSLTTLEAMACGCPILTTPTGYGGDIKKEIKNFVAENFDEFFVKSFLVSNEREKYSQLAIDYFHEYHNPENFKKEWLNVVEGI